MAENKIIDLIGVKGYIYITLLIGSFVCYTLIMQNNIPTAMLIACSPLILIITFHLFRNPIFSFIALILINYFIMGITRYYPIPIGVVIDSIFAFIFTSIVIRASYEKINWSRCNNALTWICLVWFIYCFLEINNTTAGMTATNWLQGVRAMAIYPLLVVLLVSLLMKRAVSIKWFLVAWALFTIIGAAKGYWQKNRGFDSAELLWLFTGDGARTHLISTGIRFFSFFSDAGNFGASMGFSFVTFSIATIYVRNKWIKLLLALAALAGGYGMVISGTRGALAVPFVGYALWTLISKNWKVLVGGIILLLVAIFFFKFTTIGDNNQQIRRMRTAFDTNDASFQVRLKNQHILKQGLRDLPFGIGIGADAKSVSLNNKYRSVASIPTDSWLVRVWTRTGVVGLTLYLLSWGITIIYGSYILMFKIRNTELRGVLVGMLCGTFGMMAANYGNENYVQFPNGIIIYMCQAFVFLSPFFDKELQEKAKLKNQTQTNN